MIERPTRPTWGMREDGGWVRPSLMGLIGWRIVGIAIAFVLLGIGVIYAQLKGTADSLRNQLLQSEAEEIASRIDVSPTGVVSLRPATAAATSQITRRYSIATADRQIVLSGGGFPAPDPAFAPVATSLVQPGDPHATTGPRRQSPIVFYGIGPPDGPHESRAATLETAVRGMTFLVTVAIDQTEPDALLDNLVSEFFGRIGGFLIPLMIMLLAATLVTIWVELRPLFAASELAARITPRTTGVRLPERGLPSEIYPLVHSVNSALDRLEEGFRIQREFTADVAHELRTPLAVMRAHVDALRDDEAARSLRKDIDAMSRLVNQLLRVAQLETLVVAPDQRADLHAIAIAVASDLAPIAVRRGRAISLSGGDAAVIVRADADAIEHAVRNLVENALTHTPEGTSVEVEVGADGSLAVRDFGPGVPPADRANLFRRFWRGTKGGDGAGLGLAIVARIVEAHQGTVAYEDVPGGGSCFRIVLPVVAREDDAPPPSHRLAPARTARAGSPAD